MTSFVTHILIMCKYVAQHQYQLVQYQRMHKNPNSLFVAGNQEVKLLILQICLGFIQTNPDYASVICGWEHRDRNCPCAVGGRDGKSSLLSITVTKASL